MTTLFVSFGAKSLSNGAKFIQDENGNPNSPQEDKLSFPNLYKLHNLYFLMDFYLVHEKPCLIHTHPASCRLLTPVQTYPIEFLGQFTVTKELHDLIVKEGAWSMTQL
jgi:hypothetical protein